MENLSKDYQNIILKIAIVVLKNDVLRVLVADIINVPNYMVGNLLKYCVIFYSPYRPLRSGPNGCRARWAASFISAKDTSRTS